MKRILDSSCFFFACASLLKCGIFPLLCFYNPLPMAILQAPKLWVSPFGNWYTVLVHAPENRTPGAHGFIRHLLRRHPGADPLQDPRLGYERLAYADFPTHISVGLNLPVDPGPA